MAYAAAGSDEVPLSADTLAELRMETLNVKRWVSKAMEEAKARAAKHPSPALPPMSPVSPSGSTGSPTSADSAPKAVADDVIAQQLATLLGVRKQAAAEGLEDIISGALRNLPRATEDVSRLAIESGVLRKQLQQVSTTTATVRDAAQVSDRLRELHLIRGRLVKCRTVLNDAQLLASRATAVEQAIASLHGGSMPGGIASPPSGSKAPASAKALDLAESNRVADDIASMRAALRTLQEIDPKYGMSVRNQVDRFEQLMLRGIEAQALDALKREDRSTSPALLGALRKIGRDAVVLRTHLDGLTAARVEKCKSDIAAHGGAAAASDKHVPTLRRALHALVKSLAKDKAFLDDVLAHHHGDGAAGSVAALVDGCFREVAQSLESSVLPYYTNDGLVLAVDAVAHELAAAVRGSPAVLIASSAAADAVVAPFVKIIAKVVERETSRTAAKASGAAKPSDLHALEDELRASARRASSFLATVRGMAAADQQSTEVGERVSQAIAALCTAWNAAGTTFAAALSDLLRKSTGATDASQAGAAALLEAAVSFHAQCASFPQHATRLQDELSDIVRTSLATQGDNAGTPLPLPPRLFAGAASAITQLPETARSHVLGVILAPVKAMVPTAATLAGGAVVAGTQSESVRLLGEWIMELPMTLENAGIVNDVQDWVVAAVEYLVNMYCVAVRGIIATATVKTGDGQAGRVSPPVAGLRKADADQLQLDLEYLNSVVEAIDDSASHHQVIADLRRDILIATPTATS